LETADNGSRASGSLAAENVMETFTFLGQLKSLSRLMISIHNRSLIFMKALTRPQCFSSCVLGARKKLSHKWEKHEKTFPRNSKTSSPFHFAACFVRSFVRLFLACSVHLAAMFKY